MIFAFTIHNCLLTGEAVKIWENYFNITSFSIIWKNISWFWISINFPLGFPDPILWDLCLKHLYIFNKNELLGQIIKFWC